MVGAALGATIGLGVVAFASGRVLDAGIGFGRGPSPAPSFVVGQAGMYVLVAIAGAIGGGGPERLPRPEVCGFAGDAWPASPAAFIKDAAAAIGLPVLGLVVGASAV